MSPLDAGFPRDPAPKRRMLPSVSDVVRELAKAVSADPAVLFKAARAVVAEELTKVKQGFESAPLDVLVRRGRLQLEQEGSAKPVSGPAPPIVPVFPARPRVAKGGQKDAPPAEPSASEEPFESAPSSAELGWEREIPILPEDAPFQSAIIPIPRGARGPLEISAPADGPPARAPEPGPKPASPPRPEPEELLAKLKLELKAEQKPKAEPKPELRLEFVPPPAPEPVPPGPIEAEPPPAPPPAGAERFLRDPSLPPPRKEPAVKSMSEMAPLHEMFDGRPEPAMGEFNFKAAEASAPGPARSSRKGWLAAIALVLAIGAGLAWAVREYVFRNEIVKPAARINPDVAPPASAVPAPAPAPAVLAAPAAAPAKPTAIPRAAAPAPKGRAALLLTPDWAGKPVVYVIHFSSHRDRESAAKEAKRLGAALGAPAQAVEVDLGEKGVWYRVVLGEFTDVDAARAFRADLEAKKTPGMGFVYEMRGR